MTIDPDRQDHDRLSRMVRLPVSAEEAWKVIGDFGGMAEWHPLVVECQLAELEGETYRHLTLVDGEKIFERLVETGPHYYTYTIEEGPLPVDDYRATLSAVDEDEGCHVYWSAFFTPTAPDERESDQIIAYIYETGLEALRQRFE